MTDAKVDGFQIMATGQIESGDFGGVDSLYCKYSYLVGKDWRIIQGVDTGISQIACKNNSGESLVVWNFPIDISFSTTNAHGWPRMVLSVYGLDVMGRDVVHGYGQLHIPTQPGVYTRYVRMFKPVSLSWVQEITSWLFGNQAEFYDSKFVGQGKNRDVTRVKTSGVLKVKINVLTHGMEKFGFSDGTLDSAVPQPKPNVDTSARGRSRDARGRSVGARSRSPRTGSRGRGSKSPVRSSTKRRE